MQLLIIIGGVFLWCLLFVACFWGGPAIIESVRRSQKKNWGSEVGDPKEEKWSFRFYVVCFFVGIPVLLVIALLQK